VILKAIGNVNQETSMRDELADAVHAFLHQCLKRIDTKNIPTIPMDIQKKIVALAQFGARMRGTISRGRVHTEIINSKPSAEVGTRLGKQAAKESIALAIVKGKKEVTEDEYTIVRKTILDTISQRNEDVVSALIKSCPTINDSLGTKEIAIKTKYTHATIARILADMNMLQIVERTGSSNKYQWTLSPYIRNLIDKAGLYTSKLELERPRNHPTMRVILKKAA
jgi:hypothetical protein